MSKWRNDAEESFSADLYWGRLARKTYREERRARNLHKPKRKKSWPPRDYSEHRNTIG